MVRIFKAKYWGVFIKNFEIDTLKLRIETHLSIEEDIASAYRECQY